MSIIECIIDRAKSINQSIILPEGEDSRIIEAASIIHNQQIASVSLLGDADIIKQQAAKLQLDFNGVNLIDPAASDKRAQYAEVLYEARQHKGLTKEQAADAIAAPLMMGAAMMRANDADGMVAGATYATADVVRSALQLIGMSKSSRIVSSFFLMVHDMPHQAMQGTAIYTDCGMVIDPSAEELACIAMDAANNAKSIAGIDPKVALLSFSTAGSAAHPNVDKVRQAGAIIAEQQPGLPLMIEVQFDAAVLPAVLESKAPEIDVSAPANVFVFPDLQSGNIGYKIAQRIGGVQAIGPVLQGLNKPVNDLSRGCSVQDIVKLVAVTALQAKAG